MAISYADGNNSNASTVAANTAFNKGDLIFVTGVTLDSGASFADNVNTGNYTLLGSQIQAPVTGDYINWAYKVVNVSSVTVPTITTTSGGTVWHTGFSRYTGFVLGAAIIAADISSASGNGTAVNSGTVIASYNNEAFWGTGYTDGQVLTVTDAIFTIKFAGGWADQLDSTTIGPVSKGTSVAQTGTIPSDPWVSFIQGFYDALPVSGYKHNQMLTLGV